MDQKSIIKRAKKNFSKKPNKKTDVSEKVNFSKGLSKGPLHIKTKDGSFAIRRREFLRNISPSDSDEFGVIKFIVNPGISTTFPWLSSLSRSFQKYKVRNLRLEYKTACSTFLPGMVMIAPVFNIKDRIPTSKIELLEYSYCKRAPVWKDFSVDVRGNDLSYKEYYIRDNASSNVSEEFLYDCCYFCVAADGVTEETTYIGEIWLEYDLILEQPRRPNMEVLEYDNVFQVVCTSVTNSTPLNNSVITGGFKVSVVGNSLIFGEFTEGIITVLFDQTNVGNRQLSQYNVTTNGKGTVSPGLIVSGEGRGGQGSYAVIQIGLNDFQAGDNLTIVSWGLNVEFAINKAVIYFGEGYDLFNPSLNMK
jgi:hypothetical protein